MVMAREAAERLTKTGPGTPMGDVFRRYWLPAFLSERLPEPGSGPIAVRLLGERLVAYRDEAGNVGLVQEACPHRGASLAYARCEPGGLRCIYHGWKVDQAGDVVDAPCENDPARFLGKVTARAYPTREAGGLVWTYMGPSESQPSFPEWPFTGLPDSHVLPVHYLQECNYFQAIEGEFDGAHVSFLHMTNQMLQLHRDRSRPLDYWTALSFDRSPRAYNDETPWGVDTIWRWDLEDLDEPGQVDPNLDLYLVHAFVAPCFSLVADFGAGPAFWHAFVPVDDEHHLLYYVHYDRQAPLSDEMRAQVTAMYGHDRVHRDNDYRPHGNRENRHFQDFGKNPDEYSGITGIAAQDIAIIQSQGVVVDRTAEHLGGSDACIAYIRRYMLKVAERIQSGEEPPRPPTARGFEALESYAAVVPKGTDWREVTRQGPHGKPIDPVPDGGEGAELSTVLSS
ncbi:MAG TPA: Rieske 2Fe-2S domain-containing protein [Acidimicrobiia bacterium]|nr:Rieske 2Fe-2S domain-containing protein [Acidimicrobiia bacterium]